MKLSKPEDMDEIEEQAEEQSGDVDPETAAEMAEADSSGDGRTVEVFGSSVGLIEAVELIGDVVEEPDAFGMATDADVRDLREKVAQQEKAIAELADAVEILAENQGDGGTPSMMLDPEPLTGIYDPTQEFENGN